MPSLDSHQLELISKYNQTNRKFPVNGTLLDLFEKQVVDTPDTVALEFDNISLSYSDLNKHANRLANFLINEGSGPDVRIGICANRSVDLFVSILAILKSGAAYVPFDPSYPADRITYMQSNADVSIVLAHDEFRPLFPNANVINIDGVSNKFVDKEDTNPVVTSLTSANLAYVLFTSGSTGNPKGVAMAHRALVNLVQWQNINTSIGTAARTLQFAPISFDVSFQEIFTTWTTGGTLVLINDEMRLNAPELISFIARCKIERLYLPYVALQLLADSVNSSGFKISSVRDIISAGEQLKITEHIRTLFKNNPSCTLHNHYGPTESHVVTSYTLKGDAGSWDAIPPIGQPVANSTIYILDDNMNPVEYGSEGELWIGGAALAKGYLNNEKLTAERFIVDPFDKTAELKIYKSGDRGKYNADGDIIYTGRVDSQVKVRGYRIEPGEIEIAIIKLEGINECVVTVREDDPGDRRLVAYYTAKEGSKKDVSKLRDHLSGSLPEYMIPSAFVTLVEFPKTPSGKIDRKNLPAPDHKRPDTGQIYAGATNDDEKKLAHLWAVVLKIDRVGITDNFFDLGGTSLLALKFISLAKSNLGIHIPVVTLYRSPTIKGLLQSLNKNDTGESVRDKMQQRFRRKENTEGVLDDGIAIIGMSGKFPGADNINELWEILKEGRETTRFFNSDELDDSIDKNIKTDESYVKARGILNDTAGFDAQFFGVNPKLAAVMDPQQRIFLEVCWSALEDAGYSPSYYKGLIGVFAGMGNNTYFKNNVSSHREEIEKIGSFQVMTANEKDYIATRVSHFMNLKGPAVSVHTACSTSLVSVIMACESLWNMRCDMAIAGGVAITCPVNSGHLYQEGGMFSADGHTRPFDAGASGTVFSDGAGAVILKRYRDAVKDGDDILAVVRGTGLNNDGSDKASFTAPSVEGQAMAVAMAHAQAMIDPDSISYIETHGTATPLGDPIEVEALSDAFGKTSRKQFCALGSVKSNFGHLTAAAGITGLIKTVLMLKNKSFVATVNYSVPNPQIDFENSPFFVADSFKEWNTNGLPRRAGVSSFGVGGTNAHVVLEEAPELARKDVASRSKQLIVLSAKSPESLHNVSTTMEYFFESQHELNLADACFTLQTGRSIFNNRRFIVVDDIDDAIQQFAKPVPGKSGTKELKQPASGVVFMFPGQGSQYVNMGKNLYRDEQVFRDAVDLCCNLFDDYLDKSLIDILYPQENSVKDAAVLINKTAYTQPALFTIGYALAKLWINWGVSPSALIGHSIGEYAAACIGGVMSLEDAVKVVSSRGILMQSLPEGSMISVRESANNIAPLLTEGLSVAAVNGPSLCVVSGNDDEIAAIEQKFTSNEIAFKKLHTSHAFHSPMMDDVLDPFNEVLNGVTLNNPVVPIMSTSKNSWLSDADACSPDYWSQHIRLAVRFADGIKNIWKDNPSYVMVEMGPRNTASILARQQITDMSVQMAVPSLSDTIDNDAEWISMLNAVGQLWMAGIDVDWNKFYSSEARKKVRLPGYCFNHKAYWMEPLALLNSGITGNESIISNGELDQNIVSDDVPFESEEQNIGGKENIIAELRLVIEDSSGIDLSSAGTGITFLEMGLDSLFLTQIALTISKKYNTKITFRQLNEQLSTLDSLADHIDSKILEGGIHKPVVARTSSISKIKAPNPKDVSENIKAESAKPFGAIARIEKSTEKDLTDLQLVWLKKFTTVYNSKTKKSKAYTEEHRVHLADPRVVTGFKPVLKELIYQVVVDKSKGARVWDIDGNEYIDVLNGFGSNFLGYGSEVVKEVIKNQIEQGIEIGPQHHLAGEVAKLICEFTGYDRAGFCNTGSEAVLGSLRIARTVTGRSLVVCFNGSYHGINDEVIVRGTKKLKSMPAAAGIMSESVENMLVLDYGTEESLEIIRSRSDEIAAVLVEPIQSRRADYKPKEFLHEVRKITSGSGSLLIFDEVITGFRMLPGGAQEYFEIKADLGTYGKVIGGGLPIGVIAGKSEFMDALDGGNWQYGNDSVPEAGVTYFAGTFVRHPIALAAAKAVLLHLKERGAEFYNKLNSNTHQLVSKVNDHCLKVRAPFKLVSFGSLFKLKWIKEYHYGDLLFTIMRNNGVHIYEGFPCFITDAFTGNDVNFVVKTFINATNELMKHEIIKPLDSVNGSKFNNIDPASPPVEGAKLGKDIDGNPAWFIPDPKRPGKYLHVNVD
jgi:amino acid adenylation domain-containing protein